MTKHKLEKLLASIFATLADTEISEAQEDKKDTEKNLERILKLITSEETDTNSSENPFDRSELVPLVNDCHQRYQALCGRYDHLVGKLKEIVPHKRRDDGSFEFNFSSDSESSDSRTVILPSEEERSALTAEILMDDITLQQASVDVKDLEGEVEEQPIDENSMLQRNQEDLQNPNSDMKKLEQVQKEASDRIHAIIIRANDLRMELDSLHIQKIKLEETIKMIATRSSGDQILRKNSEDETMLKDQDTCSDKLLANYKQLEDRFQESFAKLEIAESEVGEIRRIEETIQILEGGAGGVHEEQKKDTLKLEESYKKLLEKLELSESKKAELDKEIAKLNGQLQALEIQLRQSETENEEMIEKHKRERRKGLEEQMHHENECRKTKEAARDGMETLSERLWLLEFAVEENHGHIMDRISKCTEDVKIVKTQLEKQLVEMQEMENENLELKTRVDFFEGATLKLRAESS